MKREVKKTRLGRLGKREGGKKGRGRSNKDGGKGREEKRRRK